MDGWIIALKRRNGVQWVTEPPGCATPTLTHQHIASHDLETSGVQVASALLNLPPYYTLSHNFDRINLWCLRRYMRHLTLN